MSGSRLSRAVRDPPLASPMARVYEALEQALAAEAPADNAPAGGLFAQPAWHVAWARHAATDADRPLVLVSGSASRLILPLAARGRSAKRIAAANNYFFSELEPIQFGAPGADEYRDVADELARLAASACEVDLHPLDLDGPLASAVGQALERRHWIVSDYHCFGNWFHRVTAPTADAYLADRPAEVRNTLQRKAAGARRTEGWRMQVVADAGQLPQALAAYEAVYRKSWKRVEPLQPFIRDVCAWAAKTGKLRLGLAWVGKVPAAAQIWFVHAGVASIFKLAFDPAFSRLSPGSLLTGHLMRHVIDQDHVGKIDYLTGDEPYKRDWMTERRVLSGLVAFNPRHPAGLLRAARHFGGRLLRRRGTTRADPSPPAPLPQGERGVAEPPPAIFRKWTGESPDCRQRSSARGEGSRRITYNHSCPPALSREGSGES